MYGLQGFRMILSMCFLPHDFFLLPTPENADKMVMVACGIFSITLAI